MTALGNMLAYMATLMLCLWIPGCYSASKNKPHSHQGMLQPYDGKHISYTLTPEQNKKLNAGEPVVINQRNGKSGRGIVIQDIQAPPHVCIDRISDLRNYHKMVPNVKNIDIYEENTYPNGTTKVGAMFKVGVSLVTFGYYLRLTYEPKYVTYTWTLDYQYNSDFDDNTGHWQAMTHPTKPGWTRVLYSTEVKLFSWIPEFVVTFLTKTALIESTVWVKRESEKQAKADPSCNEVKQIDLSACFIELEDGGARYDTHCSESAVQKMIEEETKAAEKAEGEEL
jgi:hypothetical protein